MIEKIEMYKVGFGDCFICSDLEDENKMLVDYGSTGTIPTNIINEVNNSLSKTKNNYLMVTHFHSDHFNGLKNLNNALNFSEIYLPNFFTDKIIKLEFISLASNPKKFSGDDYNFAFNLLTIIPTLARQFFKGSKVIFLNKLYRVKYNYLLRNGLDNLRILWPDMSYIESRAKKLTAIIKDYVSVENNRLLDGFVNSFIEIISQRTDNGVVYLHEENIESFGSIFGLVEECRSRIRLELPNNLLSEISSFQNKLCLCFDNVNEINDNPVLFLSDITKSGFNQLTAINDLADYYSAIKVPHHGTRQYFLKNLPDSESLLIPNDDKRSGWGICPDYFRKYCSRKIYPNVRCCNFKCNKSSSCNGMPDYFCVHWL